MKRTITKDEFVREMTKHGFSLDGSELLYEHLVEMEGLEGEIEFDPVAFRCDFSEYENVEEAAEDLGYDIEEIEDLIVVEGEGTVIIRNE